MKVVLLFMVCLAFLVMPSLAWANCTQITYIDSRTGQMRICQQCCYGGSCQVTCF